jgi:ABC-type branched-subunit amino acid transport system substrate-binding protein
MKRYLFILVALAALSAAALWWWRAANGGRVPVGVDAPLLPGLVFDPSEVNTADLFLEEKPDASIDPRILYYGIKAGEGQTVFEDAMAEGVEFFVTTQPSSVFVGNAPKFRDGKALVINTAATSPATSGLDDYILRIIPDAAMEQRALARHLNEQPGGRLLVVQDSNNSGYTDPAYAVFAEEIAGGDKWETVHLKMDITAFHPEEHRALMAEPFDAMYILAGDFHAAIGNIAQLFHHKHPEALIQLTPWARSPNILEVAGDAVDSIILASHFPSRAELPALDSYLERFEARFGYQPQVMAVMVRQGLELLDRAFAAGHRTPQSVRDYLLATPVHETEFGPVSFDACGDVAGDFHFIRDVGRELP